MSSYNTALVNDMVAIGSTASAASNDSLYSRVASGDTAAIKEMIEGNMSLAINKVESYIRTFPHVEHLRDDLISEGFLGVTKAVNRMAKKGPVENPNPTGYMSYWVMKSIGIVVDREHANSASTGTLWNRKQSGEPIPHQVVMPPELPEQSIDPTTLTELRDLIASCCENEIDEQIVRMRGGDPNLPPSEHPNMVDKEIATALNMPLSTIYMMRRELYARFLVKSGMVGEV
jgi:hypothetical protein